MNSLVEDNHPALQNEGSDLFLVFEGGGAKGIAHVAAWNVIQPIVRPAAVGGPQEFKLSGVAGTSAGAIMAAFVAAGATSSQLIDENGGVPLCCELGIEHFYDIFGFRGWRHLKWLRGLTLPFAKNLAARLIPPSVSATLHNHGAPSRHNASKFANRLKESSPYILLICFIAIFIGFALHSYVLGRPVAAAITFLTFIIVVNRSFWFFHARLKHIEKINMENNNRYLSPVLQVFFHPLLIMLVAIIITILISAVVIQQADYVRRYSAYVGSESFIIPILYGVCVVLSMLQIVAVMRRRIKGSIDTKSLKIDFNKALVAILTKTPEWNRTTRTYEWKQKVPQTTKESELYKRVSAKGRLVRFGDLWEATGIPLHVVAADIVKNEVYVFSTETHRDVPVATAVTASLAIPFAFAPVYYSSRILVDGGVVSSIPAWLYRRHRTRDPDARILAVGIAPTGYDQWIPYFIAARKARLTYWKKAGLGWAARLGVLATEPFASMIWPVRFIANVATTAAYGIRALELDASDRLDHILMHPTIELLDFDIPRDKLCDQLDSLQKEARSRIYDALWNRKKAFESVCATIENHLCTYLAVAGRNPESMRIRMFWAERDGTCDAVRIRFTYGFTQDDLDDRLVLPFKSSMTGWAAATKRSQFGDASVLQEMLTGRMNRYRRAVKWGDLKWCWAIPVSEDNSTLLRGVLAIESNVEMEIFDPVLGEEADRRARSWFDSSTKKIRRDEWNAYCEPVPVDVPKMTQLEIGWADYIRQNFSGTKDQKLVPAPTRPQSPKRWGRALGPSFLRKLHKRPTLNWCHRLVRVSQKPVSLLRDWMRR